MHHHTVRRALAAFALGGCLLLTGTGSAVDAAAAPRSSTRASAEALSTAQQTVADMINQSRQDNGRRVLPVNATISQRAQSWAVHLRECQCLQHRRAPYGAPRGWYAVGENVGRSGNGGSLQGVHNAFMNSDPHRRNILKPRWTTMGVGAVQDGQGEWFVVHVFADYSR